MARKSKDPVEQSAEVKPTKNKSARTQPRESTLLRQVLP
ncbi:MAG: hypothetical protein K0Q68_3301, partial [Moraxellaceae bacterium]|nr:hypothetical protein [Moraxellaceae bacterium]